MARKLLSHLTHSQSIDESFPPLCIDAVDEPGFGGAHHRYEITGFDMTDNPSATDGGWAWRSTQFSRAVIVFQNGGLSKDGVPTTPNGITNEALLAIVIDRLECFQKGPFRCDDNEVALDYARSALAALHRRTEEREARGVEGRHVL